MTFKPGDKVRLISLEIDREMEAVNFLKREEKILSIGDVFTVKDVSPDPDWIELAELYWSHPASKFEKVDTVGEAEDLEFLFGIADKVLGLHDTFLKTFPDKEDKDDQDLKLSIVAGLKDARYPLLSTISNLRAEIKQLKKVK